MEENAPVFVDLEGVGLVRLGLPTHGAVRAGTHGPGAPTGQQERHVRCEIPIMPGSQVDPVFAQDGTKCLTFPFLVFLFPKREWRFWEVYQQPGYHGTDRCYVAQETVFSSLFLCYGSHNRIHKVLCRREDGEVHSKESKTHGYPNFCRTTNKYNIKSRQRCSKLHHCHCWAFDVAGLSSLVWTMNGMVS